MRVKPKNLILARAILGGSGGGSSLSSAEKEWSDGKVASGETLLPETEVGLAFNEMWGALAGFGLLQEEFGVEPFTLTVGETYVVEWDGVAYECVAWDAGAMEEGAVGLGNGSAMGMSGNGEPFVIGLATDTALIILSLTDTGTEATHRLAIKKANSDAPVTPDYYQTIFKLQTLQFIDDGELRSYFSMDAVPDLAAGEEYTVFVGEHTFTRLAFEKDGGVHLGNPAVSRDDGAEDTGEPFLIACAGGAVMIFTTLPGPYISIGVYQGRKRYSINGTSLGAIAEAIRAKTGTTEKITLENIPALILSITD